MKSILVTGGTGSFGKAFIARVLPGAERVVIYSRDEHKQARMFQAFPETGEPKLRFFIGDVRDRDRLRRAMQGVEVVVHAAALKRIEVGHYNPSEMVKTNVLGAMNVIEAAMDAGVQKVVALSTDKAFQPISPYGQSKALAESLFLAANNARGATGPIFSVTRYGNVAGSEGSVIPIWREKMLASGMNVVPISDPECTRFWMTMDEAIELVLKTIRTMEGGELVVPTLPAYRLGDLAKAMDAGGVIHGLPPHEKLHESMEAGKPSNEARRLSVDELKGLLKEL